MTAFVIAQLSFKDVARYRRYQAAFADAFQGSGGRLLAADEAPALLEGDWFGDKIVVMAFDSEEAARAFLNGPAYQAISADREAGADTVALLVHGIDAPLKR